MSPINELKEFVKTIYLGDRACKVLILDGWNQRISLVVNTISRIRDPSGDWKYYTDEDVDDGHIVFESVSSFTLEPQGAIPNDWIEIVSVEPLTDSHADISEEKKFVFTVALGAVDEVGNAQEAMMQIIAKGVYLEDPSRPGVKIRE